MTPIVAALIPPLAGSNLLLGKGDEHQLHFNLDVHTGRKVQRCECIDGLRVRVNNVHDAFVHPHFKLFAGVLVNECGTVHRPLLLLRWQRDWADHFHACPFRRINDRAGGLVDDLVIIRTDLDPHAMRRFFRCFGGRGHRSRDVGCEALAPLGMTMSYQPEWSESSVPRLARRGIKHNGVRHRRTPFFIT